MRLCGHFCLRQLPQLLFAPQRTLIKWSVGFSAAPNLSVNCPGGTKYPLFTMECLNKKHMVLESKTPALSLCSVASQL